MTNEEIKASIAASMARVDDLRGVNKTLRKRSSAAQCCATVEIKQTGYGRSRYCRNRAKVWDVNGTAYCARHSDQCALAE